MLVLPKGNPLIEKLSLPFQDVNIMLNNLEHEGFTGYVRLELYKDAGILFYIQGALTRAIEMEQDSVKVHPRARVINKLKKKEINTSTYVFSPRLTSVLSQNFAFQPLYLDYEVKQKELKKVMNTLEEDEYTGIIEVTSRDGTSYLIIDKGELVTDFFTQEYGQIVAGTDSVSKFLDFISKEGAVINIFAEKQDEIDSKIKAVDEDLEKIKQVIVKEEKGFSIFKSGDIFWIDEYVVSEWGFKNVKTLAIELETSDGEIHMVKAQPTKKLSGFISTVAGNLKKLKLKEGDPVSIKPVR